MAARQKMKKRIKAYVARTGVEDFLASEASAGVLLAATALLALVLANSPAGALYEAFLRVPLSITVGDVGLSKPLLLWINDCLMAWFFLLVGLEIKREILVGELSNRQKALMPAAAAAGGMVVPALIYAAINAGNEAALRGWAIPVATDIAFALGVLSLLGSRVPASLKIFLAAAAIIDDLGGILIIALFYTDHLSTTALGAAGLGVLVLVGLNRAGVKRTDVYLFVGLVIWIAVLKSGVHATLAGVVTALAIPLRGHEPGRAPLEVLEHRIHGWVTYAILPLFAFANAGVAVDAGAFMSLASPVALGIMLGLFAGKQIGVFGAVWLCRRLNVASLPSGATIVQMYGLACVSGIGFTMSLFIGDLAFAGGPDTGTVKLAIIVASVLSAVVGYTVLRSAPAPTQSKPGHPAST